MQGEAAQEQQGGHHAQQSGSDQGRGAGARQQPPGDLGGGDGVGGDVGEEGQAGVSGVIRLICAAPAKEAQYWM